MSSAQGIRAGRAFVELFADSRQLVRGSRRGYSGAALDNPTLCQISIGVACHRRLSRLNLRYRESTAAMLKAPTVTNAKAARMPHSNRLRTM